jgi:hypothetical protein
MPKKPPPFVLGSVFLRRGYHTDSRGFPVDDTAPYVYEAKDGKLLAFWRSGLKKPANPPELTRTTQ